jgi:hypothetical protein
MQLVPLHLGARGRGHNSPENSTRNGNLGGGKAREREHGGDVVSSMTSAMERQLEHLDLNTQPPAQVGLPLPGVGVRLGHH